MYSGEVLESIENTRILYNMSSRPVYHPSITTIPQTTVSLYSAYLDNRKEFHGPAIYLLGYQLAKHWDKPKLYGLVKFADSNPSVCIGPSIVEMPCGRNCNKYNHYTKFDTIYHILKLPRLIVTHLPTSVSLTRSETCSSQLSKSIRIYSFQPKQLKTVGLCLETPLYGDIHSEHLIKFIEINRLLGVEIFTIYSLLKPNVERDKVINTYQSEGILEVVPWPQKFRRNFPIHYFGEVLLMHDCLYRNMHRVKYLLFVDLDELILPIAPVSLVAMIESLKQPKKPDAFVFKNVYFVEKTMKKDLDYFTKLYRAMCTYKYFRRSKFIVVPTAVNNIDVHGVPFITAVAYVPVTIGLLAHFRKKISPDCNNRTLVYDPIILRYKDIVLERMKKFS